MTPMLAAPALIAIAALLVPSVGVAPPPATPLLVAAGSAPIGAHGRATRPAGDDGAVFGRDDPAILETALPAADPLSR